MLRSVSGTHGVFSRVSFWGDPGGWWKVGEGAEVGSESAGSLGVDVFFLLLLTGAMTKAIRIVDCCKWLLLQVNWGCQGQVT